MKAENINPFIESVTETFENMLDVKVQMGKPEVSITDSGTPDIIGVIGLSGTAQGIVALTLPVQTALKVIGKLVGMEFKGVDSSIIDGVGELINIIAGNAKSKYDGHKISMSLPTVVRGSIHRMSKMENTVFLMVPFESELGDFSLMVTFRQVAVMEKEGENACVNS
jgi:chemotaxis protein CheX